MKRKAWILSLVVISVSLFAFSSKSDNDEKVKVSVIHQDGNKVLVLDTVFDTASGYTVEQFLLDNNLDPETTEIVNTDNFDGAHVSELNQGIWFMDSSNMKHCSGNKNKLHIITEDLIDSGTGEIKIMQTIDEDGNKHIQKWVNGEEVEVDDEDVHIQNGMAHKQMMFISDNGTMKSAGEEAGQEMNVEVETIIENGEEVTHIFVNGEEVDPEDFDGNIEIIEGDGNSLIEVITINELGESGDGEEMNVEVETTIENGEEVTHIFVNGEEVDPEDFDGNIEIIEGDGNSLIEVITINEIGESGDGEEMNVEVETTIKNGEEVTHIFVNGEEVDPEDFDGDIFIHEGEGNQMEYEVILLGDCTEAGSTKDGKFIIKDIDYSSSYTIAIVSSISDDSNDTIQKSEKIEEDLPISDLRFSPNPNNGQFNLSFNLPEKGKTLILIHDIQGKVVYEENLGKFSGEYNQNIDLSAQGSGTYLLNITQGKQNLVERVIVK